MDWGQILTVIGANLTATIGLFLWARHESGEDRKEIAADRRQMLDLLKGIQEEMKDFHGRLERQDAEFKAHILYDHGKNKDLNK